MTRRAQLTKTLFQSGLACPKRLWWEVHEPDAPELVPDANLLWNFRQGQEVTEAARARVPNAQYEVTLRSESLSARVDILAASPVEAPTLIEVKGSNAIKPEHLWDVAFQHHVARAAGEEVSRVELMYLNRECRHPDLHLLFVREDVSDRIAPLVAQVPAEADRLLTTLDGPLPGDSRNKNCGSCAFYDRCWSSERFAVSQFHKMTWNKKLDWERSGAQTFGDLPEDAKLSAVQRRQRQSERTGTLVVEAGLGNALSAWHGPFTYLDFETVSFAMPRFPSTAPWAKIPVQYSVHREGESGTVHRAFLAADGGDPRRVLAESLIADCPRVGPIVAYHAGFERDRLAELAAALPDLAAALDALRERVVDLEPIVTDHVYHPDFRGSFSLKVVLPALCPEVTYDGLTIADGSTAQLELARLLYGESPVPAIEQGALRTALLAYCERDTWAMVVLHRRLRELAVG